jgi:hypothetical protein
VEWRELMYGAITAAKGTDPRMHWDQLSPRKLAEASAARISLIAYSTVMHHT